jgi:aminoglycoside 6'-N-acetyltransferase
MLAGWLQTFEAQRWWGDPTAQLALLRADLDDPAMTMLIVELDGRPFAYAQHYEVHAWPQPHLDHLPPGSRAIDAFIGDPDMLGRGHGSRFLRLLAQSLLAEGAPVVGIDPRADNLRARRAYAKAGFHGDQAIRTDEGPVTLMIFGDRADAPRAGPS